MPIKLVRRHGSPHWYLRGSIRGVSVDESTGVSDEAAAEDVLIVRSAEILKRSIHGDSATRTFGEAALSYMEAGGERTHLPPLIKRFGTRLLSKIGQHEIDGAARALKAGAKPATQNRKIYTPMAAVLHHAARMQWCSKPVIARPAEPEPRVRWLSHEEADRLIDAGGHLKPLVTFLLCTGVRISEALGLDWREVALSRCHVSILNEGAGGTEGTKSGLSRGIPLHPRAVAALANLPHRTGKVFRRHYGGVRWNGKVAPVGGAYTSRGGKGGGQVKTAWPKMLKRAGISNFTPHDCRHTWATWHYAANRDLAVLMELGGWSDVDSVMRYTHVNVGHLAPSIARIWGNDGESAMALLPQDLRAKA